MEKPGFLVKLGKYLMKTGSLRIVIADDEDAYFHKKMIDSAKSAGFSNIERISFVTHEVFNTWLDNNPDIIILDVQNVVDTGVAKDGIELARVLKRSTSSMLVVTSAHEQQLRSALVNIDYFISNRKLTSTDFICELEKIVDYYLRTKSKFYKNLLLKAGFKLVGHAAGA